MSEIINKCEERMNKTVDALDKEYASVRAGRANPAVLNKVVVDYYGTPTPVAQMAAVSVPEPRTLMIAPWDASTLKEIEKAIQASDIGINPTMLKLFLRQQMLTAFMTAIRNSIQMQNVFLKSVKWMFLIKDLK